MPSYTTNPLFYDGAGQILSAGDLNIIRKNVGLVDRWCYRSEPAFDSSAGLGEADTPGYYALDNPLRIWWGAFRFQTGMTTLTVEGSGLKSSAESLKVYIGGTDVSGSGTLAGTITLTAGASPVAFSGAYTISGLGYTDGQVVQVEIRMEGAHLKTGNVVITDIYASPITKSGWVAAPTFTASTLNQTKLNQLTFAADWLYDRLRLVPMVPRLALFYNLGPFKDPSTGDPQHVNRPIFYGSVGRYYSNSELRIAGIIQSMTTTGYNFKVYLNDVLAYTSPTYGIGSTYPDVRLSLSSYTLGSRVKVAILANVTNGGTAQPQRFTRWTLGIMHGVADSGGWPYATMPAAFGGPSGTTLASAIVTKLNALSTVLNDAKARIDARPEQWARARAMRRYYTRNAAVEDLMLARARPLFPQRVGDELFVKGKGVELGWGPITTKVDAASNGWEGYTFNSTQSIDKCDEGVTVYLDAFPGLDIGTAYAVLGDPLYAAERIG